MRHGRAKAARKTLQFFGRQGVTPPYSVLVDSTFLVHSVQLKVPIVERIEKLLQHNSFTLHVTRSSLMELDAILDAQQQAAAADATASTTSRTEVLRQAKQWGLDECEIIEPHQIPTTDIEETTTTTAIQMSEEELGKPGQDLVRLVAHHGHQAASPKRKTSTSSSLSLVVATQDEVLLNVLRQMGKCPLLRLSRGVLLLENPSKAALQNAQYQENAKYKSHNVVNTSEQRMLQAAQSVVEKEQRQSQSRERQNQHGGSAQRVKKRAKGPNPLSCKRKKGATTDDVVGKTQARKRRRKGGNKASGGGGDAQSSGEHTV